MNNIDVFQYIANNNPIASRRIINDYGYSVQNNDIAQSLRLLVNARGEEAMVQIMKYHPDVDYFEETFSKTNSKKSKIRNSTNDFERLMYLNATGGNNSPIKNEITANQTNLMILAAAMMVTIAIISK